MPKILKRSKKFKTVCSTCGCKLSYRQSEIQIWEPIDQEKPRYYWIRCPECDKRIYLNIESDAE